MLLIRTTITGEKKPNSMTMAYTYIRTLHKYIDYICSWIRGLKEVKNQYKENCKSIRQQCKSDIANVVNPNGTETLNTYHLNYQIECRCRE